MASDRTPVVWTDDLDDLLHQYEQTGNPAHVWRAYHLSRKMNADIPGWVLSYFDNVADKLSALSTEPEVRPRDYAAAFGFVTPGRGHPLSNLRNDARDERVAARIDSLLHQGHSMNSAVVHVEDEFHVSDQMARRAYDRRKRGDFARAEDEG